MLERGWVYEPTDGVLPTAPVGTGIVAATPALCTSAPPIDSGNDSLFPSLGKSIGCERTLLYMDMGFLESAPHTRAEAMRLDLVLAV